MKRISKILAVTSIIICTVICMTSCAEILTAVIETALSESDGYGDEYYDDEYYNDEYYGSDSAESYIDSPYDEAEWAIYWYVCGSDLESNCGFATDDIIEMTNASLPENVNVVLQTGGSHTWNNDVVDAYKTERFLYNSQGLQRVYSESRSNMGDAETLSDFLSFCDEYFPAKKKAFILWNHGGGSIDGAAFDENYYNDSLSLPEMYSAFEQVYELSTDNPPFELIGFDACLMATLETAYTFCDIGKYLVASEELEPGNGWNYTDYLKKLAKNPSMNGEELGKTICDTYYSGCRSYDTDDEITLSVVDMQKIPELVEAYSLWGNEAFMLACQSPNTLAKFGRAAEKSINYGGNSRDEGYTNMVDLGDLVQNSSKLFPEYSDDVLEALEECVIYKINGKYRKGASGLSCYYSYDKDYSDYKDYTDICFSEGFMHLYDYSISGRLSNEGSDYFTELCNRESEIQELITGNEMNLEGFPIYIDDDACAVLDIGSEKAEQLQDVYFQLCYTDYDSDMILILGRDNNIYTDWENGVFTDNFLGTWGSIDGYLCYMEITYSCEDYNLYNVPILLNDEEYNLKVAYSYDTGEYSILGARKGLDEETGMTDRNLVHLKPGDVITTLHYCSSFDEADEDIYQVPVDEFVVTEDTEFYDTDLGDGMFLLMYEMVDAKGDSYFSNMAIFDIKGDDIYAYEA